MKFFIATCIVGCTALYLGYKFVSINPHGYCDRRQKRTSDDEFIKYALTGQTRVLKINNTANAVTDFLAKYPDCCMVYRERTKEIEEISRFLWRDSVVVRLRSEESIQTVRRGGAPIGNDVLQLVDNCLYGSEQLTDYMTGG